MAGIPSHEARIRGLLSAMPGAHLSPSEFPERHLMVIVSNLPVCFSLGRTMPKFSFPTTSLTGLDKPQRLQASGNRPWNYCETCFVQLPGVQALGRQRGDHGCCYSCSDWYREVVRSLHFWPGNRFLPGICQVFAPSAYGRALRHLPRRDVLRGLL